MGYVAFDNTRLEKNRVDFAQGLLLQTGSSNQTARTEYKSSDIRPTCISFIATSFSVKENFYSWISEQFKYGCILTYVFKWRIKKMSHQPLLHVCAKWRHVPEHSYEFRE